MEEIEKDFDKFLDMMKWNLVQKHYVNELKLEVTPEEATEEAKAMAAQQFAYYGMSQVADDMLANYAKSILENKGVRKNLRTEGYRRRSSADYRQRCYRNRRRVRQIGRSSSTVILWDRVVGYRISTFPRSTDH